MDTCLLQCRKTEHLTENYSKRREEVYLCVFLHLEANCSMYDLMDHGQVYYSTLSA